MGERTGGIVVSGGRAVRGSGNAAWRESSRSMELEEVEEKVVLEMVLVAVSAWTSSDPSPAYYLPPHPHLPFPPPSPSTLFLFTFRLHRRVFECMLSHAVSPRQLLSHRFCLSICLSICQSVCLSACLSVCLSVRLFGFSV